jgi:hypothetical protein
MILRIMQKEGRLGFDLWGECNQLHSHFVALVFVTIVGDRNTAYE